MILGEIKKGSINENESRQFMSLVLSGGQWNCKKISGTDDTKTTQDCLRL